MKSLKNIKKIFFIFLYGVLFNGILTQNICDEFEVIHLEFEPQTEWGNLLRFELEVPDTSIYAPYFYLSTDDDFIQITDSISSYFWVTGPTVVDLLYHFEHDTIPENHDFSGIILMISGDDIFNCEIPFEFLVNIPVILGDVNEDGVLNIADILIVVDMVLSYQFNEIVDFNFDSSIDVLDILILINILLEN